MLGWKYIEKSSRAPTTLYYSLPESNLSFWDGPLTKWHLLETPFSHHHYFFTAQHEEAAKCIRKPLFLNDFILKHISGYLCRETLMVCILRLSGFANLAQLSFNSLQVVQFKKKYCSSGFVCFLTEWMIWLDYLLECTARIYNKNTQ